jgi:hypothetical protein
LIFKIETFHLNKFVSKDQIYSPSRLLFLIFKEVISLTLEKKEFRISTLNTTFIDTILINEQKVTIEMIIKVK